MKDEPVLSREDLAGKLFCDLATDLEKAEFIEQGRAYTSGIMAMSIEHDVADAYRRAAANKN